MNLVIIKGRLSRDPEVKTTASGMMVARVYIAVDRPVKGKERKADFIGCVAFDKTAELLANYFTKGKEILVTGRIQTGSYTTDSGDKRYTTDVVIDRVEFCGNKETSAKNAQVDGQGEIPF